MANKIEHSYHRKKPLYCAYTMNSTANRGLNLLYPSYKETIQRQLSDYWRFVEKEADDFLANYMEAAYV